MAATITKDALNLRELLAKVQAIFTLVKQPSLVYKTFSGNGSQTVFVLPSGFKPYSIYVGGTRQLDAVWSVTYDVNICSITFTAAPAAGTNNIQIDMVRI